MENQRTMEKQRKMSLNSSFRVINVDILLQQKHISMDSLGCSLAGFSVPGISQARILEWVLFPSPGDVPDLGIEPRCPVLQADSLPLSHLGSWESCYVHLNQVHVTLTQNTLPLNKAEPFIVKV